MSKDKAIEIVLDRLEAWHDGARIAAKQSIGTDASIYRNEMMNYAYLIDVLKYAMEVEK